VYGLERACIRPLLTVIGLFRHQVFWALDGSELIDVEAPFVPFFYFWMPDSKDLVHILKSTGYFDLCMVNVLQTLLRYTFSKVSVV